MNRPIPAAAPATRRPPLPPPALPDLGQLALNERLVRERDRERARELVRKLALGVAVLLPLLIYLYGQVAFMESALRVTRLRDERDRLEHLLREVRLERASLESLDRIADEAQRRLDMAPPSPDAVWIVGADGHPGPAPQAAR
jgi:cell division protein FtsL